MAEPQFWSKKGCCDFPYHNHSIHEQGKRRTKPADTAVTEADERSRGEGIKGHSGSEQVPIAKCESIQKSRVQAMHVFASGS